MNRKGCGIFVGEILYNKIFGVYKSRHENGKLVFDIFVIYTRYVFIRNNLTYLCHVVAVPDTALYGDVVVVTLSVKTVIVKK